MILFVVTIWSCLLACVCLSLVGESEHICLAQDEAFQRCFLFDFQLKDDLHELTDLATMLEHCFLRSMIHSLNIFK